MRIISKHYLCDKGLLKMHKILLKIRIIILYVLMNYGNIFINWNILIF